MTRIRNVVLVHGGFVDGSGWQGVYDNLAKDGYRIHIVQNPTLSLEGDVAATRHVLDTLDGPAVLVGHSYGGVVITEAGTHPHVAALAYIAAFAPDKGESVSTLIADPPPGAPVPPILPPRDGFSISTVTSFTTRSPPICPRSWPRSWPTHRSPGAWTPSAERSPNQPGGTSRAGTSSPPRTA
ncbi:alpha/beta fold hydrolase [Actinopolymorpha pittospori]|uniref:Pimeloyl-ACP methyl ester carboxylesterase n=1 Tax=Actinopolymorpha pittospori TaxID=648752 RepID=A0A927N1G7_9ACTN|nr:alpha/beta hydrolase [Actinopolymorpha pittospori]MBE1606955.1 pimeloyl-ACP methyl ester carboxylesterase [Actinopolymorpha pittospori]